MKHIIAVSLVVGALSLSANAKTFSISGSISPSASGLGRRSH
jgi:hypothetical protein